MRRFGIRCVAAVCLLASVPSLAAFPADWIGRWTGGCRITPPVDGESALRMELAIGAPDSRGHMRWQIDYDGAATGHSVRPYELVPISPGSGHYVIDEKQGILLDTYFEGDTARSLFEVNGKTIQTREEVRGDSMEVEMTSFNAQPVRRSGGSNGIPEVLSFPLRTVQRCKLRRGK